MTHVHVKKLLSSTFSAMADTFYISHPLWHHYVPLSTFLKDWRTVQPRLQQSRPPKYRLLCSYVCCNPLISVFAGQLLSTNSSGGSSLTSTILSMGILPTFPDSPYHYYPIDYSCSPQTSHYSNSTRKPYHYY